MKKEIIAIALLAALFAGSLLNIRYTNRMTFSLSEKVSSAMSSACEGDWDSAEEYTERAIRQWGDAKGYTRIFIRHTELDVISAALREFKAEILSKDRNRSTGMGEKALEQIKSITETEGVSFGSLF